MVGNTAATLSALFKETYADKAENLIPDGVKVIKNIPFAAADKELSEKYVQPVQLTHESGFSYGTGIFTLEEAEAAIYKEANVEGSTLLLRSTISYSAAARLSNSKKAFVRWADQVVKNMVNSHAKRKEIRCIYGDSDAGIGRVDGAPAGAAGVRTITLLTAEYAAGIWAGSAGSKLDVYDTTGVTQRNPTTNIVVTSVDIGAKTITVSGLEAELAAIVDTDIMYWKNAKGNEVGSIDRQVTNTGTLFNIDASAYELWKGNVFDVGGAALTFAKIQEGIALAVDKGLDQKLAVYVSTASWPDLLDDQAALRQYDKSYSSKEMENGAESLKYFSQNGMVEVIPSIHVKQGEAFGICHDECMRLGATDNTFRLPGKTEDEIFLQIPDKAGYEMRYFSEDVFFCEAPGRMIKWDNIVNS